MGITIRHETEDDYRQVEEIARRAFWNLYLPGGTEHYLIHTMRNHPDFIPELAFVIEVDGKIVGSIFYTHTKVERKDGSEFKLVSFGPVSIDPELHRQGLGRRLITHSIEEARRLGHPAIIMGGYPYHYEIYGFCGSKKYGISMPDGKFYTGILALPLHEGALDDVQGKVVFSEALYPDESAFEAYDATFPYLEKKVLPCQAAFEKASTEIDERDWS